MKNKLITGLGALLLLSILHAQHGPLNGSGNLIQKNYAFVDFDKVALVDLAGKVEIEVGKPFSVSVVIDDNLAPLLEANVSNSTLQVQLKGNHSNRLYIEQTNILLKIALPSLSFVQQLGNNNVIVNGISGQVLRLKSGGNGSTRLSGSVMELEISSSGNGTVHAEGLAAKKVSVYKTGNSNVYIHADDVFSARGSGNGNVVNSGNGRADNNSDISGNGEIKYTDSMLRKSEHMPAATNKKVNLSIINLSDKRVSLSVIYPVRGSYGIGIPAKDSLVEALPVGAKIFSGNQFTLLKSPLYVVKTDSKRQSLIIQ